MGNGTRQLTIQDVLPKCEVHLSKIINYTDYIKSGDQVADIGCGFGPLEESVVNCGATWVGIEPFPARADVVDAPAEKLPFPDGYFDVVILDAVFEHIPDVAKAFTEIARVLKPGAVLIGYSAFMESFHEISYNHLSYKGLEFYSDENGLELELLQTEGTGVDYHIARALETIIRFGSTFTKRFLRPSIRSLFYCLLRITWVKHYMGHRVLRKMSHQDAVSQARDFYVTERLRYTSGYSFVIRKKSDAAC
ncbi:MAG TPA: hypothetical protein DCX06_05440 [Opitutae bacterium]|nr:hypothetical protein [Opitutae bacterium]